MLSGFRPVQLATDMAVAQSSFVSWTDVNLLKFEQQMHSCFYYFAPVRPSVQRASQGHKRDMFDPYTFYDDGVTFLSYDNEDMDIDLHPYMLEYDSAAFEQ